MAFGNGKAASPRLGIILEGPPSKDLDPSTLWPCHGKLLLLSLSKTLLGPAMVLWALHMQHAPLLLPTLSFLPPQPSLSSCCSCSCLRVVISPILPWQSPMNLWTVLMVYYGCPEAVRSLWCHMPHCSAVSAPAGTMLACSSPHRPILKLSLMVWLPECGPGISLGLIHLVATSPELCSY